MSFTPEQALQAAETLKAYAAGERIEYKRNYAHEEWQPARGPLFNFDKYEYRVAPPSRAKQLAKWLKMAENEKLLEITIQLRNFQAKEQWTKQEIKDALDIYFGLN